MDGGRVAAYGFRYQYWRTLEALLDVVDDPAVGSVRVEGPPTDTPGRNAIDFDVLDVDGRTRRAVQVKSKPSGGSMAPGEALGVLLGLIRHDADSYELLTNAVPAQGTQRLAAALEAVRDADDAEVLPQALTGIISTARLVQVRDLPTGQRQRLLRCRVRFDPREEDEIRDGLRERLRAFRSRTNAALGQRSAGLLFGYLVAEILDRAADEAKAVFTIDQLRAHLLISHEDLARGIGSRDWGILVGPMPPIPDVARPSPLRKIADGLRAQPSHRIRRVVLLGPSGIGKSSLAAAYVADRADAYDCIFWVDGDSEPAFASAFRRILTYLQSGQRTTGHHSTPAQLRDEVHTVLSGLPGRWLMVVDNVVDRRLAERWIPVLGTGDTLITSIDSAAPPSGTTVPVGVMEPGEAVELLRQRLRVSEHQHADALHRLARELAHWPLALELAAGYMASCGLTLDSLDHYLSQLKARSLNDPDSIPPAYPRTLGAALALCLQELERRIGHAGQTDVRPYFALTVLTYGAYLAPRRLPVHLLIAAAVSDPAPEEGPGPRYLHPSEVNVGEVIRELRRFSLVNFDDDLPPMDHQRPADADRTVTLNTIVQELLRVRSDRDQATPPALNRLANHLERWLMPSLELNLLERTSLLVNHAEVLADHICALSITGERIPLFYGNLAGAYRASGELDKAEHLLRAEIQLLRTLHPNPTVLAQARLSLATVLLDRPDRRPHTYHEVVDQLGEVLAFAAAVRDEYPAAAVKFAIYLRELIDPADADAWPALADLAQRSRDLISSAGPTRFSDALDVVSHADELVTAGRFDDAELCCRDVLRDGYLTGPIELKARRVLVESLLHQRRWAEAEREHDSLQGLFGGAGYYRSFVSRYIHDVGVACATAVLLHHDQRAAPLLARVVNWPIDREQCVATEYSRILVLTAVRDCVAGDYVRAAKTLQDVRPADLSTADIHESQTWCSIWQLCRLVILRGSWLDDTVIG